MVTGTSRISEQRKRLKDVKRQRQRYISEDEMDDEERKDRGII